MDSLKVILESFETFIKRSLLPSSTFMLFLVLYDIFLNKCEIINYFREIESIFIMVLLFILFLGLSTVLTILHQIFYDNSLKGNFDTVLKFNPDNQYLIKLREEVQNSLKNTELKDYFLYHQLLTELKNRGEELDTVRYVDDAKTIGITFISMIIILISFIYTTCSFFYIPLIFLIYFIGREVVMAKYRSRAIYLYTIYLNS